MLYANYLEVENIIYELNYIFGSFWYNELLENFRHMVYYDNFEQYDLKALKLFTEENMRILEERKFSYFNFNEIECIIFYSLNLKKLYLIRQDRLILLRHFKRKIFEFIKLFKNFQIKKNNYELVTNPVIRFLNQEINYEKIFINKISYKLNVNI